MNRLIANDPYMATWNATIFANATAMLEAPITEYVYVRSLRA